MSIHMIRYEVAPSSFLIDNYLPQWLATHTAWEDADNQPPEEVTTEGQTTYQTADWRFAWSASKSVLLDNLVAYSKSYADWGLIQYHECDHDEAERAGCSVDQTITWGTIPDDI